MREREREIRMKQKRSRREGEIKRIFTFFLWTSKRPLVLVDSFSNFTSSSGILHGIRERERASEREREWVETKEIEKRERDKATSSPSSHGVCPLHVVLFTSCRVFYLDSRPLHVFTFLGIPCGRRPTKPLTRHFPWPSESTTGSV